MITVDRISEDKLSMVRWIFTTDISFDIVNFRVYFYGVGTRPSTRHKFTYAPFYSNHDRNSTLKREDVPIPDDVFEDVKSQIEFRVL